ncbi:PHP domain-containing protein [archaeon]|nr:PHP domain-containing protein [archaeon]
MKIDLHIHSKYSGDCKMEPADILKAAEKAGLGGVAITDHDTVKGGIEASKIKSNVNVIVGAEIRTKRGEVIGYFLNEEIEKRELFEVIDAIHDQGGIACIPHPYDSLRIYNLKPKSDVLKAVDCIEVLNSRCAIGAFNKKAKRLAKEHELGMTAGSDAHTISEIGSAGVIVETPRDIGDKNAQIFGKTNSLRGLAVKKLKRALT